MSTQIEGLLIKNFQLMKRQKASIICQVITPIICLGFIFLIKAIIETQLKNFGFNLKIELPLLLNIPVYDKLNYANNLIKFSNCDQWYLIKFSEKTNNKDVDYLGYNDGHSSKGILASQKNVLQTNCNINQKLTPYFKTINNSINDYLYTHLEELNYVDLNKIKDSEDSLQKIPDGAIEIFNLNDNSFSYKLQINDLKFRSYHRSNGVTKTLVYNPSRNTYSEVINVINGALIVSDLFNRAYSRHFFPNDLLISGIQIFPLSTTEGENIQRIINISGSTFYPLAISLMMPLFMYSIILEKDAKLIEIMKINGLKMRNYWSSNFIFNMILYSVTMIVFVIFGGCIMGLTLFTETSYILQFIVYLGWGFNQIGLAYFFQAFLSNPRTATIIGYIISLWTTLLAVSLNFTIFNFPAEVPNFLIIYPSFTMVRIIYHLTVKCGYSFCIPSIYGLDSELKKCLYLLYITPWILMFLGIYFYEVLPQQYGVRRHPLFFLPKYCKKGRITKNDQNIQVCDKEMHSIKIEEEDIKNERIIIEGLSEDDKFSYPLIAHNLTKIYVDNVVKSKLALNNLNLLLKNNEIFGLLGPNGAGKTTFFSLLTGIFEPSSGDAYVGGYSIKTQIDKVQQLIGYCPQFDILWNDLTVKEHLYFYSRLKNVDKQSAKINVKKILESIKLKEFKNFLVRELSGGMKRRLSLGISLVGNPSIVFLDEPTTGLDPENKRQIWEILSNCKDNKCMILTTHIMEEAEVLSDRIGIIIKGQLQCLGTQYKLRKVYGKGFKLVINMISLDEIEYLQQIERNFKNCENFLYNLFPNSKLTEKYKNTVIFQIPYEEFDAEKLFMEIQDKKSELFIINWAISQVTLEDIFINLTESDIIK